MEKIFIRIYNYFEKRQTAFWMWFICSFLIIGFFASRIHFEEDISKVLPKDKKIEKLNQVFQNSKFLDKLVIMLSLKDSNAEAQPDSLISFAENFVSAAQQNLSPYIKKINDKVDDNLTMSLFNNIYDHLPVYLNDADYKTIDTLISAENIKPELEKDFRTLTSPAGLALKTMIAKDPVGISYLGLKKMQQLQYDDNYELYNNYVITKDHQHLLLFIVPAYPPNNTGKNEKLLNGIDKINDSLTNAGFKNIDASYFGATAVSVGNALQLRKDSLFTQGITVFFLIFFIGLYFRKKRAPFIVLVPVLFGALFSLAAIYFIKSTISVIALGAGSVVLGVAVNYSLHVFNHYRHTKSIHEVIKDLTMPLTVGSFTTIGGFLCLEFVESEMLKDLGLFAAFSLIGASLCSLIFLPHLIASKKEQENHTVIRKDTWLDKIASYNPEYNKFLVGIILIFTIVFFYTAQRVGFENDLASMNYMPEKLKQAQTKLNSINAFSLQSVYLVSEGKNLNEALENNEKLSGKIEALKQKGIVKKYSGVSSLIISDSLQKMKIAKWNSYWTTEKKTQLISSLEKEGAALKFSPSAFDNFKTLLNTNFQPADTATMAALRRPFLDDYINENAKQATVVTLVKVAPENKQTVFKIFDSDPTTTVLDKQYLTNKFVEIINNDFTRIALMSSVLVFFVLLLTYGRIELTLISFIPMFITFIWILGIMGIFGMQFNIINIIISAFIFGLGDDYSLFIMDGLLQEYKTGKKNLSSYKSSIFLSAITTVAGLGVLIFAKHPALKSIAIISIVGIVCVVIMSQILIPFLFNILIRNRVLKNKFPWTLSGFLKSIFAFGYFIFGTIILTVLGILFIKINPFNKEKGKYVYHLFIAKYCRSLMYIMANVKKTIINPLNENFSTPAVIICNHQSELDILCTAMLHPKLILFTNQRVWNASISGFLVRMADYYPVVYGADSSIDLIADRVKHGYSVVVFPEGTRSVDGNMKRFHKGAFYLAEKLNLDILPLIIHGTNYTLSKKDTLLKDGKVTMKFLPRIKPEDKTFGTGYTEKTKLIGRYFRGEFAKLRNEIEQPAYFREQLIYNYIYKGPVLEWYMKVKTRLEKSYQLFHDLLPKQGKILDGGCGYGFMTYMLQFASNEREITGIDYDEEKIETANHSFSKNDKINFFHADITNFNFEKYDGIVLADMLHYLQPAAQKQTIENCMESLNENGVLIIRDGNSEMAEKHKGTKLTEFFSTKFFGFNKTTEKGLSFLSASFVNEIAKTNKMECKVIDETKYTSNIIFVIKKQQLPFMQYDVIIIGSGIGGLVCGNILSLEGLKICVLEKNKYIGGCLQTFVRDKVIFDSGVHYIGGLCKGQNLYQVFKYLGLMEKLKLEKMDENAFDKIIIDNDAKEYPLAQGYENFISKLSAYFPEEKDAIIKYCEAIQSICKKFPLYNLRSGGEYSEKKDVLETDTKAFIESLTSNKKLQSVLAGNNFLYAGQPQKTPFYIHALILNSYIESSWKCVNGGSQIAKYLAQNIRKNGGVVLCNKEVVKVAEQNGKVSFVETNDVSRFIATNYISNMHPEKVLEILETKLIKPAYRNRIKHLENSISCFSVNVVLKKNTFKYFSHNYYWHKEGKLWDMQDYNETGWPLGYALFLSPSSKTKGYADSLSILTYMKYDETKHWENTFNTVSNEEERGKSYDEFKKQKAEILLRVVEEKFPTLKDCIQSYYVATPLSYRDYLGTNDGSLYGIVKDYKDPVKTLIAPQTKLPNFYFTGQNLNLHGILGASITALATCCALLGNENIVDKIRNA